MIEVVTMGVGDEDRRERSEVLDDRYRDAATNVENARAEQRIRQQPGVPELGQHRGMPDVCEPVLTGSDHGVAATFSRVGVSASSVRHPLSSSWTPAAPTIGSDGAGSSTGCRMNGRVWGPPRPPWNEISSSNAQPSSSSGS